MQVLGLLVPLDSLLRQRVRDEAESQLRPMPDARVGRVRVLNSRRRLWLNTGRHWPEACNKASPLSRVLGLSESAERALEGLRLLRRDCRALSRSVGDYTVKLNFPRSLHSLHPSLEAKCLAF